MTDFRPDIGAMDCVKITKTLYHICQETKDICIDATKLLHHMA